MEDFQENITNCEQLLYRGFTSTKASDLGWLNKCCGCICQLFHQLHKIIVFEAQSDELFIGTCFLCFSQVVVAIQYLERILEVEASEEIVLAPLREFFLDRILVCLIKIKELCGQLVQGVRNDPEPSIVTCFDTVLELLGPFCQFNDIVENEAERNATAMLDAAKIRSLIECIISQTLSFAHVLENKTPLTLMCQRVLRECEALQAESALDERLPNDTDRKLKASILESAIYALENLINSSLLRLVFESFGNLRRFSLTALREGADVQELADATIDSLMQIGQFAINFANDFKVSAAIRSCLASIEALESHLCGDILRKYDDHHFRILEEHWTEETSRMERNVQRIIDTSAMCSCFEEICEEVITTSSDNLSENLILKSEVLFDHFKLNLDPSNEKVKDFNLMVKECKAAFGVVNTIDPKRLTKRFKIMKTTVKRVRESLKSGSMEVPKVETVVEDEIDGFKDKFLAPELKSILYESTRRKPRIAQSNISMKASKIIKDVSLTPKKTPKRKMSLRRVALTKAYKDQSQQSKSLSLHITEILNELTSMSTNFANHGPRSEVQVFKDNKIRIHVIGDI